MRTILLIAYRNLIQSRRRALLLGLAIAMVSMFFLMLRSITASISERMIESATTLSAGHVNVGGFFKGRKKASDPLLTKRGELKSLVREIVPESPLIIDRHRGWGRIVSLSSSMNVGMSGIVFDDEDRFFKALRLAPEREYRKNGTEKVFGNFDNLREPNTVLIFATQAKKLEVGVGDLITVVTEASGGQSNTADLKVAAIASDIGFMSNWNIFLPRQTILDLYRISDDSTGVIMVYLNDPSKANVVMERLRSSLTGKGYDVLAHDPNPFWMKFEKIAGEDWLGQKIDLTIWSDEISFVLWITTALNFISVFIVGILSLIIVGGLSNSVWMSVRERTKEIGTVRAIGAQRSFVLSLFVVESIILGVLASGIGVILGAICLTIVNSVEVQITNEGARLFLMANTLRFNLHLSQLITTVILFAVVTGLAAWLPALRASRLRPVEALAHSK